MSDWSFLIYQSMRESAHRLYLGHLASGEVEARMRLAMGMAVALIVALKIFSGGC